MLRVGLTGGLGSGKSTAAVLFAARGAHLLSSDRIGVELMQPGQRVYQAIVERFGRAVLLPDGQLDRAALARAAFELGQAEALNEIVHPAVIAEQERRAAAIFAASPDAVVIVESALIFETRHGGPEGWRHRFDRIVLVTAPESLRIARFLERSGATADTAAALEAEARRRMILQIPDEEKIACSDFVLVNDGSLAHLEDQVEMVWRRLRDESRGCRLSLQ